MVMGNWMLMCISSWWIELGIYWNFFFFLCLCRWWNERNIHHFNSYRWQTMCVQTQPRISGALSGAGYVQSILGSPFTWRYKDPSLLRLEGLFISHLNLTITWCWIKDLPIPCLLALTFIHTIFINFCKKFEEV